jgi:hypothetical protein
MSLRNLCWRTDTNIFLKISISNSSFSIYHKPFKPFLNREPCKYFLDKVTGHEDKIFNESIPRAAFKI